MATPLVAPAIAAAIAQLIGVRLRHTPFMPDRVKKTLAWRNKKSGRKQGCDSKFRSVECSVWQAEPPH